MGLRGGGAKGKSMDRGRKGKGEVWAGLGGGNLLTRSGSTATRCTTHAHCNIEHPRDLFCYTPVSPPLPGTHLLDEDICGLQDQALAVGHEPSVQVSVVSLGGRGEGAEGKCEKTVM